MLYTCYMACGEVKHAAVACEADKWQWSSKTMCEVRGEGENERDRPAEGGQVMKKVEGPRQVSPMIPGVPLQGNQDTIRDK